MKRFGNYLAATAAVVVMLLGTAGVADAQRRNERQIRDLVRSLNAQIDDFQFGLENHLRGSSAPARDIDDVGDSIRNLQTKVDDFNENLSNRRENRDDVRAIIAAAQDVDAFLTQNPQNRRIDSNWQAVRTTIDHLAQNYDVTPDWRTQTQIGSVQGTSRDSSRGRVNSRDSGGGITVSPRIIRPQTRPVDPPLSRNQRNYPAAISSGLTGTYALDPSRSENTADIVSSSGVAAAQRQDLESKLEAPQQIAIQLRGTEVTLASSKSSPVSFVADGRDKTEMVNGKTVRLRATLRGEQLTITSVGGDTDYSVTFVPTDNGRTMKVTRRITTSYLRETVFAESIYTKTDSYAGLGISGNTTDSGDYSSNDPVNSGNTGSNPSIGSGRTGEFLVPAGTVVTGLLESTIDTKLTQNYDRFKLTVQSPDEFRGATIEGYVTGVGRSGQISGRSNVTFNFETITLRTGERYDFAGYLQSVKDQNGKEVRVDNEGIAKGDSQTRQTAKRGGIGAGLGAIIGAIAGGVKGAAIGAIIGGGAGAGSVVVQGRDDLQLMRGSMVTIQSTSPAGITSRVSDNN